MGTLTRLLVACLETVCLIVALCCDVVTLHKVQGGVNACRPRVGKKHTNESMRNADALRRRGSNPRVFHTPCSQLSSMFIARKAKFSRALRARSTPQNPCYSTRSHPSVEDSLIRPFGPRKKHHSSLLSQSLIWTLAWRQHCYKHV